MALVIFIKTHLEVCEPNEIMIFSGRKHRTEDGRTVGYRVIRGGRRLRTPFVETVSRMSLNTVPIELTVKGALTSGVIPVNVKGMANVKIAGSEEDGLANAIERFLGKDSRVVAETAQEIIEGTMRGLVATMLPEEANANRREFARRVAEEARADLGRMGIVLDTLKIQEISDEKDYLGAVARRKNAEVQRDARIAEAESNAEASRAESEAKKRAELAEIQARRAVTEAERAFRVEESQWTADVRREEERAKLAGEIARMIETKALERERVEANQLKYEAEVVIPADAERQALEKKAVGEAAYTFEEGRAKAEALKLLRAQWEKEGSRDLFMIQLLPEIVDKVAAVVASNLQVERLTVVDTGNGGGIPQLVGSLASSVNAFLEQIKTLTGQDLAANAGQRLAGNAGQRSGGNAERRYSGKTS